MRRWQLGGCASGREGGVLSNSALGKPQAAAEPHDHLSLRLHLDVFLVDLLFAALPHAHRMLEQSDVVDPLLGVHGLRARTLRTLRGEARRLCARAAVAVRAGVHARDPQRCF